MIYFAVDNLCATNHDAKEETRVFYDDVFELVSEGLRPFVFICSPVQSFVEYTHIKILPVHYYFLLNMCVTLLID